MKPDPTLVTKALQQLSAQPDECAMIGDSVTDIEVSTTTGVRSIGYAKNSRRGHELHEAGADALVATISELAHHPGLHTPV